MSWYAESYGWIKGQQMENPGLSHAEMRKHCSKNYPFRERRGYAYKAFLEAMRDIFGAARPKALPGQLDIFKAAPP